ncbi:DUF397 domain-containing protein [Pseudonocardia yunnanensis]|uniref:DUF397 domain-containing protein n=1 Tax=Pseudonocardia yunnanensis TaxID=58107 RepID=A0ABW4F6T7_9PSEU
MPNEDLSGWSAERFRAATWRKSSFSGQNACVEVATLDTGDVAVRHSRHPSGPALVFTPAEWSAFLTGAQHGEFAVPATPGSATT